MNQPDDPRLTGLVEGLAQNTVTGEAGSDRMYLIDRSYQVRQSFILNGDLAIRKANRLRQELLKSKELLAVVTTGWALGFDGSVMCQYFPAPGQVKLFALTWPVPMPVWTDPTRPESEDMFEAYQTIWRLDNP